MTEVGQLDEELLAASRTPDSTVSVSLGKDLRGTKEGLGRRSLVVREVEPKY